MKKQILIMCAIGVVIVGLGVVLFNAGPTNQTNTTQLPAHNDSYVLGPSTAKVSVIEYGDFQCPACALAAPIITQLQKENPDQIKVEFRHFPLLQHKNAVSSALAAEAAGQQGKFWEMYDMLYARQRDWAEQDQSLEIFMSYAAALNLNTEKFAQDMTNTALRDKIQRDLSEGQGLGINSTPTFYVNGVKLTGVPGADFRNKIQQELNK